MQKRLIVDEEKCTGCSSCILACSFGHYDSFSIVKSRIQVLKEAERAISKPWVCIQCEEAPCISSCPVDALSWERDSAAIHLNEAKCIGCKACIAACPFDGIFFYDEHQIPLICDLCGGIRHA